MTDQRVLDILNDVLTAMEKSPCARLADTGVSILSAGTEECDMVHRILEQEGRYAGELAELLIELGGTPAFGVPDAQTARFHYLDLHFLLTQVLRSKEQLLAVCESALEQLPASTRASQLVAEVAAAHRQHIASVQQLIDQTGSSAGETS